ncbi:hypothetical protein VTL71DRAFT_12633 [Oculimacula yallundae]|uniref:A-kinase anchor protein 7-like phosphoesterase domain-containing protein n=1 Tax=Oculimacula yallundae TaxID=86028 RepID=A0ABR4CNV9_9HELO
MPPKPSPRLTHFLAIPLTTTFSRPQLQTSLQKFKSKAISPDFISSIPDGLPDQAIRPLGTLHLTLGVMSLLTPERVEGVLKLLKEVDLRALLEGVRGVDGGSDCVKRKGKNVQSSTVGESQLPDPKKDPRSIYITLQGLHSMHDPAKTSVLYASPLDPDLRLYRFCVKLREVFAEFLVSESRPLLLHVTIVNTIYVKRPTGGGRGGRGGRRGKERLEFDAREVVREWEDFVWMENVKVESIKVLRMGAKAGEGGEEYEVEGEVDMPVS